ncbi:hypothetical protein CFS9_03650 [Flavobacterium sp. CFS9]|uniref:Uncharacterized protein n=1 Tax=Flavobacterium sp. CFS9 TaxID=3143118 RepID=A0AAT9GWV2_9FLAO
MGNITDLIKDVADKNQIIETFAAKVIEINNEIESSHNPEDAYTVNIMRADGAILKNVRLKASIQDLEQGIITIPKKNSWVLASIIGGVETRAFISQYSEIERTFLRFKNEQNKYLEIDSNANKFQVLFKEKKENDSASTSAPQYKSIAQIEFVGGTQNPNISTSFYNAEGKEISTNSFNINEQKVSINEGSTLFNLKDKEITVTIKDGFEAIISDTKTSFKKGDLSFEMDSQFKINAGNKTLLTELENLITEVSKITVIQGVGPNVGELLKIKSNLKTLLKK